MENIAKEQARQFRLWAHHLDRWYQASDLEAVVGACGLQNTPPGAWEGALYHRIPEYSQEDMRALLERDRGLLQAWSVRGAPVVFPAGESDAFLSALVPEKGEPWIYTQGLQLALDFLQMPFEEALLALQQVVGRLDGQVLKSKTALDQTLAQWMLPLIPGEDRKKRWEAPSMYGSPDKQTVGGAVVSFLLRPCAFMGQVVFGRREGVSPTFTSYRHWVGHELQGEGSPGQKLARKYLHCFGPASLGGFADWLGCSPAQARRMWQTVEEEIEPVRLSGRERYILTADRQRLLSPPPLERTAHLLTGHDPYLGLRDRETVLEDEAKRRLVWQTVSNPGAVLCGGAVAGMWKPKKKGGGMEVELTLWGDERPKKGELEALSEGYASFRRLPLNKLTVLE